jgi:hypothetical protein
MQALLWEVIHLCVLECGGWQLYIMQLSEFSSELRFLWLVSEGKPKQLCKFHCPFCCGMFSLPTYSKACSDQECQFAFYPCSHAHVFGTWTGDRGCLRSFIWVLSLLAFLLWFFSNSFQIINLIKYLQKFPICIWRALYSFSKNKNNVFHNWFYSWKCCSVL